MSWEILCQSFVSGIVLGSIYLLVALGINIIFGVMRILNFSHGVFVSMAMYFVYVFWSIYNIDPYISSLFIVPVLFMVGVLIQKFLIKPILETSFLNHVTLTVGLFFVIKSFLSLIFSESFIIVGAPYRTQSYVLGNVVVGLPHLIALITSILLTIMLNMFLGHTDFGRSLRAIAQSREGALACGVDTNKIFALSFGIGVALAGIAGWLLAPFYPIYPHVGDSFLLSGFIIAVLGGLGSFKGCWVGSYVVALTESFTAFYISPAFQQVTSLILFMVILLIKPTGLFGVKVK